MSTAEQQITQPKTPAGLTRDDVRDLFQEFISKRGVTPEQGGNQLMADNAELRADKRSLKEKLQAAEAKVPADGALVLTGADVKLFEAAKAVIGRLPKDKQTAEELEKVLKEHGELIDKVATLEKQNVAVQIAEAENWKPSVLLKLTAGMDLLVEEVDEEVDDEENEGKKKTIKARHGFLNVKDAQGNVTGKKRLSEELKDFMSSLAKERENDKGSDEEHHEEAHGTSFVRQSRGDKVPPKKASTDFLSKRYAATAKTLAKE